MLDGFLYSKEFAGLCALYGILPFVTNKNIDNDADGYTGDQGDCNDNDYNIHPGAVEVYGDGIDQNCDGYDEPSTSCTDISGDWYITETVTVSCCLDGNCETDSFTAEGLVTIQQSGCDFYYDADVGGYGTFMRTGTVDGNEIRFNGLSMVQKSGCATILDSLDIGGIVGFPDIKLLGSGILTRTCSADRFSCTVAYSAQLQNVYPYPSMLSNDNQDGDW